MKPRYLAAVAAVTVLLAAGSAAYGYSSYKTVALDAIAANWPTALRDRAAGIAWCESHYRYDIVSKPNKNGTRDHGLFQLNDGGTLQSLGLDRESALDPYRNAAAAYRLYQRRGWQPWVCA